MGRLPGPRPQIRKYHPQCDRSRSPGAFVSRCWGGQGADSSKWPKFGAPLCGLLALVLTTACAPATLFRDPVAKFQAGVNTTAGVIQPYFVELNRVEIEYQLHNALREKQEWGTQHLALPFRPEAIRARLEALEIVSAYAKLLGDMANSRAPEELEQAAARLETNAKKLSKPLHGLLVGTDVPDFSGPLGAVVKLVGQVAIERRRQTALTQAILTGDEPIRRIIDLLREDLAGALALRETALAQHQTVRLDIYNKARSGASPAELLAMMEEISRLNGRLQTLRTIQVDSLLREMRAAHEALVTFAKSDKNPKDLSDLAGRVDVFADQAALVASVISAMRSSP